MPGVPAYQVSNVVGSKAFVRQAGLTVLFYRHVASPYSTPPQLAPLPHELCIHAASRSPVSAAA